MEEYWLALRNHERIGNLTARRLVERFNDPKSIFEAGRDAWLSVEGVGEQTAARLAEGPDLKSANLELERIRSLGVDLIPITSRRYPHNLKSIHDAPLVLYDSGGLSDADQNAVAIVGARDASGYGVKMATYLARELAAAGVTVVSGLALGIDAAAHRGALAAGGRTIAVLGCGIDCDYPKANLKLRSEIKQAGTVLTEFAPGIEPKASHFPQRNRLISGLALGVVVVEADMKSGSLITARLALEQGREVFAVPGNVDSRRNRGCHWLIKQGARLVDSPGDVLQEIAPHLNRRPDQPKKAAIPAGLGEDEHKALTTMNLDPIHIDDLARQSGIPVSRLSGILLTLELQGLCEQLPGTMFRRKVFS